MVDIDFNVDRLGIGMLSINRPHVRNALNWSAMQAFAVIIEKAHAYRTTVVEAAKANADYLQRLLPEYRLHPKLVIQKLYLDAMKRIYENADEKFIVQSTESARDGEVRVMINKDPSLKSRKRKSQDSSTEGN